MDNENISKDQLIEDIKILISVDKKKVDINPKYLEFFELDELIDIKDQLEGKKTTNSSISGDYLDEIFTKCS